MYKALIKTWTRFRHNDDGVTLVEYGVAVSLAILVGTVALALLATDIGTAMGAAGDAMLP